MFGSIQQNEPHSIFCFQFVYASGLTVHSTRRNYFEGGLTKYKDELT